MYTRGSLHNGHLLPQVEPFTAMKDLNRSEIGRDRGHHALEGESPSNLSRIYRVHVDSLVVTCRREKLQGPTKG